MNKLADLVILYQNSDKEITKRIDRCNKLTLQIYKLQFKIAAANPLMHLIYTRRKNNIQNKINKL